MPPPQTLKTSILVALLIILNSAGNFFFGLGMKRIGALHGWSMAALHSAFVAIFSSVWIWLGIVSMLLFLAALMLVLSWADFSYVLPATASMYAVVPLLGHFVLGERVTALALDGSGADLRGSGVRGAHAPEHHGEGLNMRTAITLVVLVFAGTGGDIAVAHAMKRLGEVQSFTPGVILRFLGRAFREGWMWIGIAAVDPGVLFPARFAFLGGGELCGSRHGPELCYRRAGGKVFPGRAVDASALGGNRLGFRGRGAGVLG